MRSPICVNLDSNEFLRVRFPTSSELRRGSLVLPFSAASFVKSSSRSEALSLSASRRSLSSTDFLISDSFSDIFSLISPILASRALIWKESFRASSLRSSFIRRLFLRASFLWCSSSFTLLRTSSIRAAATSIFLSASLSLTLASAFFSSYSVMPMRLSRAFILSDGVRSLSLVAVPWRTML